MTPTQLRAYAAVVRLGSAKDAAAELEVSEAAISLHMKSLRAELEDKLYHRSGSGLAFTPGGLRLAIRAQEMLGLQDQTRREVLDAAAGRRVLRLASSSMFAEHAAPGLIELFSTRADDLEVELSVTNAESFATLLSVMGADLAIGPSMTGLPEFLIQKPFLKYQMFAVAAPTHRAANTRLSSSELSALTWHLGPSATEPTSIGNRIVRRLEIPEPSQRIYQSHAAAMDEVRAGNGVGLALGFTAAKEIKAGTLARVDGPGTSADGLWNTFSMSADRMSKPALELRRFITTPRATQAMLSGSGAGASRFKPKVHITLWS